jgi:hypothetical protein
MVQRGKARGVKKHRRRTRIKMADLATVDDIIRLKRALTQEEIDRANALLPVVSAFLRDEAHRQGKDLDEMIASGEVSAEVVVSVVADIVLRELNAPTIR